MATEPAWITSRQIEAARRAITHYVKRGGKVWIRIFPDKPVTQKPAETRMGSGKGSVEYYVAVVKPGRIMFELGGVREDIAIRRPAARGAKAADQVQNHRQGNGRGGVRTMKTSEIRELDGGRLNERLREIDQELFILRFQKETGRLTNTARFGQLKIEYARIKTVLRERELTAAPTGER